MSVKQSAFIALVLSAVLAGSASADPVYSFIDFRGSGGLAKSYEFSAGGMSVTATGASIDRDGVVHVDDVYVGQYGHGLGVSNSVYVTGGGGLASNDGSHTVDGSGYKDILWLEFDQAVWFKTVFFGYTNSGDRMKLLNDNSDVLGTYSLSSVGNGYYAVTFPGDGIADTVFGLKAPGKCDGWKVTGACVSPIPDPPPGQVVPTPAAFGAGALLFGLLGFRRKLRARS